MGLFDFFRRKRGAKDGAGSSGTVPADAAEGVSGSPVAAKNSAGEGSDSDGSPAANTTAPRTARGAIDSVARFRELPLSSGVREAMTQLERAPSDASATEVLRWLRSVGDASELAAPDRLALADWFAARDENEVTARILRSVATGFSSDAAAAWARLAEIATRRGQPDEAARCLEEVLAIDLTWPGARERYARTRAPARAGGAGATLISPESAKVGRGRYALVRELGRGGAGAVYLARDSVIDRDVAFKIYHPGRGSARLERLRNEASVAASLASRHVVRMYDLLEEMGAITMEHCASGSLKTAIARRQGEAIDRRRWLAGVAHALKTTHEAGFVHRDLKPGNVLLRVDGTAVVTDFGIAVRRGVAFDAYEGTPGYTAPEIRSGVPATPQMDVFAFGALARELIAEQTPEFTRWVSTCLAPDPSARPADGTSLVAMLRTMEYVA